MNMRTLALARPSRLVGVGPVTVRERGSLFYCFAPGDSFTFTLPVGTYEVENAFLAGDYIPGPELDGPEVDLPGPLRVTFTNNPNTCSIDLARARIICDRSLRKLPRVCLTFVLFHEIGHYLFNGAKTPEAIHDQEVACDAFAAREMLRRGWNPSQIAAASELTLSLCSQRRKNQNWDALSRVRRG